MGREHAGVGHERIPLVPFGAWTYERQSRQKKFTSIGSKTPRMSELVFTGDPSAIP